MRKFLIVNLVVLMGLLISVAISTSVSAENAYNDTTSRLNFLVEKYNIKLDEQSTQQVVDNCNQLQTQVAKNQISAANEVRTRISVYSDLQNEIKALELRMMRQGVDASELDLLIGKIQEKQDELNLTADKLGTAGDDMRIIDCKNKPAQFKAGLKEYQQQQKKLVAVAKEARQLMTNSPNSTFNPLKGRLSL
jgi:hypothetical protein